MHRVQGGYVAGYVYMVSVGVAQGHAPALDVRRLITRAVPEEREKERGRIETERQKAAARGDRGLRLKLYLSCSR